MCLTSLRKHIATMSHILNLSKNELDILARFMGHDIKVHREYYRLSDETLQIAKVSKLLLRMEKGGYGLAAGQKLDSIELKDNGLAEEGTSFHDDLFPIVSNLGPFSVFKISLQIFDFFLHKN